MTTIETITLPYCIPDMRRVKGYAAGRRPYREGGVRIEKEKEDGKVIYHDYGHGGAGISIAYGCAFNLMETLFSEENAPLNEEVAVLGSGIIGLVTAYLLV
jgi:hypothetical protein